MDKYDYLNVGVAVEKNQHFSGDDTLYRLLLSIDGRELCFTISKEQYTALHTNGIPRYANITTPEIKTITKL